MATSAVRPCRRSRELTAIISTGFAYENQASYFVNCVRNGRMPIAGTAAQARLAVLCAEAARRSLESGTVVAL